MSIASAVEELWPNEGWGWLSVDADFTVGVPYANFECQNVANALSFREHFTVRQ